MGILALYYRLRHPGVKEVPYMYQRSIFGQLWHTIRKFVCQNIAPNCVTNFMRVNLYRMCGFKIGRKTFIGMKCYLDDLDPPKTTIGSNVTISYGVYFACHGRKQDHHNIEIQDNAYLGMRCVIIARQDLVIGDGAIVGAMTLVNKSVPPGKTVVGVPCRELSVTEKSADIEE